MDPNATLAEIREIRKWAEENPPSSTGMWEDPGDRYEKFERLCELTEALDDWITNGGFLPEAWRTKRSIG